MDQDNYVEGSSIQIPPLLETNGFFFWKACFDKSKDIDLWQVIQKGDFYYEVEDSKTKLIKETPYELLDDDQKKKLGKNGFAAALAVLITEASQSRQHGKSEPIILSMTKAITNFGVGTITIYTDIDPFLEETKGEQKRNDDLHHLLDFNIDDVPLLGEEGLLPFVCRMGKNSRNKKRAMENFNFFYQDIGTSSSVGEEERSIIETMDYNDKYKKILDKVWKDKVELDGKIVKEEEKAGHVNENPLADTRSDINTMPYRIYETLGREDMEKVDRGITMINQEAIGILSNVLYQGFLRTIGRIVNTPERLFLTFDGFCHQTFHAARSDIMRNTESDSDDEKDYQIKRNKFGAPIYGPKPAPYLNCNNPDERSLALQTPDYKGLYTKEEEAIGQ
uniref:Uncharacterized protein n=1 Tax=Tanacetum cinerariifolium TaxID=118510 RepID=A0A6L2KUU8_TANCI|nr:hypothetical protein [Tanacetum cinerariifolium]